MKLTAIILLVACLQVSATGRAQSVTISVKGASLEEVFQSIRKQTGYLFWYDSDLLKDAKKVSIELKNVSLEQALQACFKGQPFSYKIVNKTIVVKLKSSEQLVEISPPPPVDVKGKIVNENGEPVAGATVTVKGTSIGTSSNTAGEFSLSGLDENAVIIVSSVGYESREVTLNGKSDLLIRLKQSISKLDEVKIIGYGTTTQRLSIGSVSKVSGDEIANQPVTNPLQALAGRVPGLQITQANGLPGAPVFVQIRGQNSIAAGNEPLYIVDGVPFTSAPIERFGGPSSIGQVSGSPLNMINPDDIASVEILKDADATAIYGSRASNGVILITTKKAKSGHSGLTVNFNTGAGSVTRVAEVLNTQEYLAVRRDGIANSGLVPTISNAPDLLVWDTTQNIDWQDWYMGGTARATNISAGINGGNEFTNFILSGSYHDESSVLPTGNGYKRGNLHLSVNHVSADRKLRMNAGIYYTLDDNNLGGQLTGPLLQLSRAIPDYPVYDASGGYNWVASRDNYMALLNAYYKSQSSGLNGNLHLTYQLLPTFSLQANLGLSHIKSDQVSVAPIKSKNPAFNPTGSSSFGNQSIRTMLFEPQANYKTNIGKGKIGLMAGATIQRNLNRGQQVSLAGYTDDLLLETMNFGTVTAKSSSTIEYKYLSFFSRINFNWDNKYLFNGNFRRDGSSRFGPGKQFGNFGSIGTAWLFSSETFVRKNLRWLSYGKLRASYGTTGNDGIGDYAYLSIYSATGLNYGGSSPIVPSRIGNDNYQWEINRKLQFALDLGFVQDRVLFTAEWYRNRSGNQLVGYPLPSMTGFTSYQANLPAEVQNTGWEFELNSINIKRETLSWTSSFNLTIPRNKLLSFPGIAATSYANSYVVGQPLSIIQKYHFTGVDPQTGLAIIDDVNGDGSFTNKSSYNDQGGDYIIAGNTSPAWFAGFSNTVSIKNFTLDVFFQYTRQQGYNLYGYSYTTFGRTFNAWKAYLNYWKKSGEEHVLPIPSATSGVNTNFANSDYGISDASFLRLKNIALSYRLPGALLSRYKIKELKIYIQAQNIVTITDFVGYDPETATEATLMVPPLKMVTVGIQCSF